MDNTSNKKLELVKKIYEEGIPLHRFLGLKVIEMKKGFAKIHVPFRPELIGDARSNYWHGGIIASALDSAGGIAAGSLLSSFKDKIATLDMRVDYLKPGRKGAIYVTGEIIRGGTRSVVTGMKAYQESTNELIAEARAVFSIKLINKKEKGRVVS